MNITTRFLILGGRVFLATLIALTTQVIMVVKVPNQLLTIQEGVKTAASGFFRVSQSTSQYHVAYNIIGGDNMLVHSLFVVLAYLLILLVIMPFAKSPRELE